MPFCYVCPILPFSTILYSFSIRHWQKIHVFWSTVRLCKTINLVTIAQLSYNYMYLLTEALLPLATVLGDDKHINIGVCRVIEAYADCKLS